MDEEVRAAARFVYEQGLLKRLPRQGWFVVGVKDPESVADHAYRTAIIGVVLAAMEGADPARVALMCVLHDSQETRVGDITHLGRRYLDARPNESVTADQAAGLPAAVRDTIQSTVDTYEAQDSLEARVARDADKLDCLVQAVEYREAGYENVGPWIESNRAALTTDSGRALAEAALSISSQEWWQTYLRSVT